MTWILLFAPAWIPIVFKLPGAIFVAVVVLIFDAYWVLRAVSVVTGVYSTMLRMRRDMRKDWLALCRQPVPAAAADPLQFLHLCVVPTYTEPYHVLERTVQAIVDSGQERSIDSDFPELKIKTEEGWGPRETYANGAINGGGPTLKLNTNTGSIQIKKK